MPGLARHEITPLAWRLGFLYAALFVVVAHEYPLPGQAGRVSSGLGFPLVTQSGRSSASPIAQFAWRRSVHRRRPREWHR